MKPLRLTISTHLLRWGAAACAGIALYKGLDRLILSHGGLSLHGTIPGLALVAMCHAHGLPETLLRVELTETQAVRDIAQARLILSELRAAGIGVLVDDFGTGFASMSILHDLPFSGLKIDRQFVQNVPVDRASAAIVRASVALARQLGLSVIAEGVEDQATAIWLQRQGIDLQQGFFYAPALPARTLLTFSAQAECRTAPDAAPALCAVGA